MRRLRTLRRRFARDQGGATAIEYGLIVAGVALVIAASPLVVGNTLSDFFASIADALG